MPSRVCCACAELPNRAPSIIATAHDITHDLLRRVEPLLASAQLRSAFPCRSHGLIGDALVLVGEQLDPGPVRLRRFTREAVRVTSHALEEP